MKQSFTDKKDLANVIPLVGLEEYESKQPNIPSNIIILLNLQNQISQYLSWCN